jgi:hypothetical protein
MRQYFHIKIKYRIVILLLLAAACPVYGQRSTYLTIYGMGQRTFMYNSMETNHADLSKYSYNSSVVGEMRKFPTYSMAAGFLFKREINKSFLFCYGFQYAPVHQSWDIYVNYRQEYVPGKFLLTYLKMPLLIQYNYLVRNSYQLFVSGGPQLSMLLTAQGAIPAYGYDYYHFELIDPGSVYRNFTFDGVFATGGELKISKNTAVFLQAKVDYSFTNAERKKFYELNGPYGDNIFQYANGKVRPPTHNISAGICLGLTFKIK